MCPPAHPDRSRRHRRYWTRTRPFTRTRMRSLYQRAASTTNILSICILIRAVTTGCSLSSARGPRPPAPPPPSASVPQFGHVVMVLEENHSYSEVVGNSAMPYLNSLAAQYGLATQYFANTHPSIGNYFMLTTGPVSYTHLRAHETPEHL